MVRYCSTNTDRYRYNKYKDLFVDGLNYGENHIASALLTHYQRLLLCCSVFLLRHHVIHESLGAVLALNQFRTFLMFWIYNIKGNLVHNYKHIFGNIRQKG